MPIVLRVLGPAQFGVWGAAASLAWMSGFVDIGTGTALVTLVARSVSRNESNEARDQIAGALAIGSCLSVLMLAGACIAWLSGVLQGGVAPYLIAFIGLALNAPLNSANNVWMALQEGYVSGFWELVQTVLTTTALITAATFTHEVWVYVALVYAGLVLSNLGSLIHLFWIHPELRPEGLLVAPEILRGVAFSAILFFTAGIASGLSFMLDNVLALQLLGPEAAARMTIAMRICLSAMGLVAVMSQPLWPAFTEAAHTADRAWIRQTLLRGSALLVGSAAAGALILVLFGEWLLRLWLHTNLGIGRALLVAISAWIIVHSLGRVPYLLTSGLSLLRFQVVVFSISTSIAWGLKFILGPLLGVSGILWGTTIPVLLIVVPASIWRIYMWADESAKREKIGKSDCPSLMPQP
jgi:O-antigen/teichoic acid export membrane protein